MSNTLRLAIATWEGEEQSLSSGVLKAVCILLATYGSELDEEVFKEKLGAISVKQLVRKAKERHPGYMGYCEAMVIEYNGKRKAYSSRLDIRKLYGKNKNRLNELDYDDEQQSKVDAD